MTRVAGHALKCVLPSMLTLWVVDVAANLNLLERTLRQLLGRDYVPATPVDFLSVFIMEAPVAVAVAGACVISGVVFARFFARVHTVGLITATAAALVSGFIIWVQGRLFWNDNDVFEWLLLAAGAAVVVWFVVRTRARAKESLSLADVVQLILSPALIAAFGGLAIVRLSEGHAKGFILHAGVTMLAVLMYAWGPRIRSHRARSLWAWLPVALTVAMAGFVAVSGRSYGGGAVAPADKPNGDRSRTIILIVLDTVRADHLQRYGYGRNTMPALERWVDGALVIDKAVSPAGWTAPAHASLFSGRPVSLHGIHYATGGDAFVTAPFDGIRWLPALLADAGYYCLAVSANHNAVPTGVTGFHRVLVPDRAQWGYASMAAWVDDRLPLLRAASERLRWRTPYVDARTIVDITMRAVPDRADPLFLFVNLMDAHAPYNPPTRALELLGLSPRRSFDRYRSHRALTQSWCELPEGAGRDLVDLYDGELRWLDLHLGRLLRWIDQRYGRDALVVITSDHGEELGENGRVGHEFGLSQTLIHVPLFVRAPSLRSGVEADRVVTLRQVPEFLLTHAGLVADPDEEVLFATDEHGVISERYPSGYNISLLGADYDRAWVSLIDGDDKAVGPSSHGFRVYRGFDQETPIDPTSRTDLRQRVDRYWAANADPRHDVSPPTDEELRKLRALGYVK